MMKVRRTNVQRGSHALVEDHGSKLVEPKLVQILVKEDGRCEAGWRRIRGLEQGLSLMFLVFKEQFSCRI